MSRLMATVYDRFMAGTEAACLQDWRRELLKDLSGAVLEIGAGTGVNLPLYPSTIDSVLAIEPDPHMRKRIDKLSAATDVRVCDGSAENLPCDDDSVDAVVSTLVLCSVPDPLAALHEARRVLVPGGRLIFLEHVSASPNSGRAKWQRRIEPLWKRLADGCCLTRDTEQTIVDAGFAIESIERTSMRKAPPWVRPTIRGFATLAP